MQETGRPASVALASDVELVGAVALRKLLGNISDMSLWRWINDEELHFPPAIVIQRRRFWRLADIERWLAAQASKKTMSPREAKVTADAATQ
jgi:predicted DNA-binding transcriptional regulator AlpA